jgi:hypothetical protein
MNFLDLVWIHVFSTDKKGVIMGLHIFNDHLNLLFLFLIL